MPPVPAPPDPTSWASEVVNRTLDNGMLTRVQRRTDSSFAAVCLEVAVGQADDPPDHAGLAHLVEHLAFSPMEGLPEGFGPYVEALGASYVNASTSSDETRYCTEVPAEALEALLYAEATRLGFALGSLDEDDVERERAAVLHEQRERGSQPVGWRSRVELQRALYGEHHPYARPWEDEDSVERLELDHVRWFVQRWYGPANTTLAVVSPHPEARVAEWIDRYFAPLRGQAPPERVRVALPTAQPQRLTILAPSSRDQLVIAWVTPPHLEPDDAALDLVADRLQDRLDELFEVMGDIRQMSVRVHSRPLASSFQITLSGAEEADLTRFVALLDREVSRLVEDGLSRGELAEAQRLWSERFRLSVLTTASRLASGRVRGREDLPPRDGRYDALTLDEVNAAIVRWLAPSQSVVVHRRTHGLASFEGIVRRSRR